MMGATVNLTSESLTGIFGEMTLHEYQERTKALPESCQFHEVSSDELHLEFKARDEEPLAIYSLKRVGISTVLSLISYNEKFPKHEIVTQAMNLIVALLDNVPE